MSYPSHTPAQEAISHAVSADDFALLQVIKANFLNCPDLARDLRHIIAYLSITYLASSEDAREGTIQQSVTGSLPHLYLFAHALEMHNLNRA